jgi:WD40 repeat protein
MRYGARWAVAALLLSAGWFGAAPAQEKGEPRVDLYGDPLPPGALARLGTTRWRMSERNAAVTFTPSGKVLLAAGDPSGRVALWDVAARTRLGLFPPEPVRKTPPEIPPKGGVDPSDDLRVAFSADGKTLFALGEDLVGWEVATGKRRFFERKRDEVIGPWAVAPAGGRLAGVVVRDIAVGWQVETLSVWDTATGKVVCRVATAALTPWVRALAFAPDGKRLACSGNDGAVWILDASSGNKLHQLKVAEEGVTCLTFSPDGQALVGGTFQGSLRLWDPATGKERRRWPARSGVTAVAFSRDGKTLASAGRDDSLQLWDPDTGKPVRRLSGSAVGVVFLCFSPDDRTLAASGIVLPVQLFDVAAGKPLPLQSLPVHRGEVFCLAYSPDGKALATGSQEPTVRLWEPTTGKPLMSLEGESGSVLAAAFPPGENALVAAGEGPAFARRWDLRTRQVSQTARPPEDALARPVALTADGKAVWWASRQKGETFLQDVQSGVKVRTLDRAGGNDQAVAASPDGKTIAGAVNGNTLYLWDATTGRRHTPGWVFEGRIMGLAFSPGGRSLALATEGEQSLIQFCDLATGKERGRPVVCPERVTRIAFAPDGRTLATVSADQTVRVWDVEARQERVQFKGHEREVRAVAFAPDGRTLATGSADTTALVWDLTGGDAGVREGLPALWNALAGLDATRAHRSVWGMVRHGGEAVAFLRERVKPVAAPAPEALARLVADVGSDRFSVRERAFSELEKVGELAGPAVRVALEKPLPLEVRRRLEKLLDGTLSPERLRELRAVEVLDRLGTPEARQVLRELAEGTPGARLTREAKGSLDRLGNR